MKVQKLQKNKVFKPIKSIALTLAIGFGASFAIAPVTSSDANASSALRSEMNKMFGSMSNVTAPGVMQTSRRGVISGGSVVVRNRVVNPNIVSFVPPSWNAGCGGIDFFGGSFSFINKEQFVQLGRTIASNAMGYAFHLALEAMSPAVRTIIQTLQDIVSKLNQHIGNSCQLAQGIVNDATSAFDLKGRTDVSLKEAMVEGYADISKTFLEASSSVTQNLRPEQIERIVGNIVWKALKDAGVGSWTTYGGDDLLRVMMTMTGSLILEEPKPAPDGLGESQNVTPLQGYIELTLIDFIKGNDDVRLMRCDGGGDSCTKVVFDSGFKLVGFEQMFRERLIGDPNNPSSSGGIVGKIRRGEPLSNADMNFMGSLPNGIPGMIFRLSRLGLAEQFVTIAVEPVALLMAWELVSQFQNAVVQAINNQKDSSHYNEAIAIVSKSRDAAHLDYIALSQQTTNIGEVFDRYNSLMTAASGRALVLPQSMVNDSTSFR